MRKNFLFLMMLVMTVLFCSCSDSIPDGKGKLEIRNETENSYVSRIYYSKDSILNWKEGYSDSASNQEHYHYGYVYLEPETYQIMVVMMCYDMIPITVYASATIEENEVITLYYDGLNLHK